jgi:diguanylate cyclase (GGDEF)-like protein
MDRPRYGRVRRTAHRALRRLEADLEALTPAGVWRVLFLSIASITGMNFLLHPFGLHVQPLYILPLCLAAWRIGLGACLAIAAVIAGIATGIAVFVNHEVAGPLAIVQFVMLTLMLGLVSATVTSFRSRYERERDHASFDALTGALNRKGFLARADAMLAQASAQRGTLLLAFIDLDGFKAVNDRLGHAEGDQVLSQFSKGAMRELRRVDCFGRHGGDEFAVLAPLESESSAHTHAGFIHRRFTEVLARTGHDVTCSVGALVIPPDIARTSAEWIGEADRLMYIAKREGRNRVTLALPHDMPQASPTNLTPFVGRPPRAAAAGARRRAT